MNDLKEHFERLAWVKAEILRLETDVAAYVQSDPLQVYWHYDLGARPSKLYRMRLIHPLPSAIQIHAGAIINEMRSILDALACTLAQRNGFDDVSGTYFATGKNADTYKTESRRKQKKISERDTDALATLKPYGGGNDLLYALHSLDLTRKHRRLIVLSGGVAGTRLGNGEAVTLNHQKIMYIKVGPGRSLDEPIAQTAADYHIEINQVALVAFAEPETIKNKPVVPTLNDFAMLVESALQLFD